MSTRIVGHWAAMLSLVVCAGCSQPSNDAPKPLPVNEMALVFQEAFANASSETKTAAYQFVADLQNHNTPAAFAQIQELRAKPDLTKEQRQTLGRAMMTASQELQKTAASGDQESDQTMRLYKSTR